MVDYADVFLAVALAAFSATVLFSGLFTAYFGAGKSRRIGLMLVVFGLLGILVFFAGTFGYPAGAQLWDPGLVLVGVVAVLGAMLGGLVALALFLFAIMRA